MLRCYEPASHSAVEAPLASMKERHKIVSIKAILNDLAQSGCLTLTLTKPSSGGPSLLSTLCPDAANETA